jgi:protein-tyrosine kinase
MSRLNLIQRAMQRYALSRVAVTVDDDPLNDTNGRPQSAFSEQNEGNGAPSIPRWKAEPAQIVKEAEPVYLDYAKLRASRIVTPDNKSSATYNEFRSLKRKLIPMTRDPGTGVMTRNVVMLTSALPGEGKTFTVMSLAICLAAERDLNVILVDGDVVRGSIADYFHGKDQGGLVELLTQKRQRIDDMLHPCADLPGLHVLFAGKRHDATPELLASPRMADICAALSKYFRQGVVLFDTPPVLAASEPVAIAAHAHHLIMLIAAGQAARHQVEAALTEVSCCPSMNLLFNRSPQWERPLSEPYSYTMATARTNPKGCDR